MKFLFDLLPVIIFFGVFKWGNLHAQTAQEFITQHFSAVISGGVVSLTEAPILLATAVMMIISLGQIAYLYARGKKVDPMLWLSFIIVALLGSATLYFHSENFIKWKPTVLYWAFSLVLLGSQIIIKKNLIRTMMQGHIVLPDSVWNKLLFSWVLFFAFMGALNLYVAFNFSTEVWVNFKLFGGMGLVLVFAVAQSLFLARHIKDAA